MKKFFYLAVAACAALAACSKNEVTPIDVDQQITFQAVVNKASTKAGTFDNSVKYPTDRPFGTYAFFYTTSGGYTKDADKYIDNAKVENATNTTSGQAWTTNPVYYWPKQGYLTFMSYSPYEALSSKVSCEATASAPAEIIIKDWDVDANQTVDIMIADRKDDQNSNGSNDGYTGVSTVFRHKLAQLVNFSIATTSDFSNLDGESNPQAGSKLFFLKKIEIKGVTSNGTFNSGIKPGDGTTETTLGVWQAATTPQTKNYTWYDNAAETLTKGAEYEFKNTAISLKSGSIKTNGYLLVRPQSFTDTETQQVTVTYVIRTYSSASAYSDETVTQSFNIYKATPSWEINKKYSFNITVGLDQIYWAPSIEDWADGTSTTVSKS